MYLANIFIQAHRPTQFTLRISLRKLIRKTFILHCQQFETSTSTHLLTQISALLISMNSIIAFFFVQRRAGSTKYTPTDDPSRMFQRIRNTQKI